MRRILATTVLTVVLSSLSAAAARAQNEGQEALTQATQKKLSAESLADLNEVVRLCDQALKKGLDETNTEFANSLLTGTLVQRATILSVAIFDKNPPDPRWPELRGVAIKDLERAIKVDPKLAEAHYLIARLNALRGGDLDRAHKAIDQAIEHTTKDQLALARYLTLRANLTTYDLAPKTEEAKREAEKAAEKRLADYAKAIELAPDDEDAVRSRGRFYLALGKYAEAIKDFNRALELDEEDLESKLLRVRALQLNGDAKAARADLDELLKRQPRLAAALELRAVLAANSRDFNQAIADFEELLKLAPKNPELLAQIGILYQANKKPAAAIEKFTTALEQKSDLFPALRARADAYLSLGKQADAIADYEKAIKIQGKDSSVLNNLAWVLATSPDEKLRDGKRSIELATLACEVTDYKAAHILSTLAAAYAETGQWDEAVKWSKKAVELGDDDLIKDQLKKELASYEAKKPWRERQEMKDEDGDQPRDNEKKDAEPVSKKDDA
jgi:tetratricopeptide (TPR) repeat protein